MLLDETVAGCLTQDELNKPGEVSEWLKEHAWKVCIRQRIEGSNPSLSANKTSPDQGLFYWRRERVRFLAGSKKLPGAIFHDRREPEG